MGTYQCPLCGRTMERNLVLFLSHTDEHIIDKIKEEHPEWVEADGVCKPCAEYYKKQLSGELTSTNIGPAGRKRRRVMGIAMLVLSGVLALGLISVRSERVWRLLLFVPVFSGMLGLIQAREKTCAVLAEFGMRDMDSGQYKIDNRAAALNLKTRGRIILIKSALWALAVTALFFLF